MRLAAAFGSLLLLGSLAAQEAPRPRFLILCDIETQEAIGKELGLYRDAIQADGLEAQVLTSTWNRPERVRDVLRKFYEEEGVGPLVGAALVGRIPVPMLRDAQHLTSAFKMDQVRYPMRRSSVPSDRFYEDFDLRFDLVERDAEEPDLFYYSLRHDGAQRVRKEIYTSRIHSPENGEPGYERMRQYLRRVAARKRGQQSIERMLLIGGHGYNSEALPAWTGEHLMLREQLPQLFAPGGWLGSWYHQGTPELEHIVLRELRRAPLQLAVFHAHGAPTTQYLTGELPGATAPAKIEDLKRYLRMRLRRAKDREKSVAEEQLSLMQRFGVPLAWFDGAFDEELTAADAKLVAKQDLEVTELLGLRPRADFVIFDQCFNGRFIDRPSVAAEYVFGGGDVVVAMANTVNVLQDIWPDMDFELLGKGARVGELHKRRHYLESTLIGDPTWRFAPGEMARRMPWIEAMRTLRQDLASRDFTRLEQHVVHPCELVRRKAAFAMGDVGLDSYAGALIEALLFDPSKRVQFNAKMALQKLWPAAVQAAWKELQSESAELLPREEERLAGIERMLRPPSYREADLKRLADQDEKLRRRIGVVRGFRNQRVHHLVPRLVSLAQNRTEPEELRVATIEALGWFQYSHRQDAIRQGLERLLRQEGVEVKVEREARKTLRRLKDGANEPLTP